MNSGDRVALAALVVGLVALVIASGQLIQQVFGTADGYRRCKSSVIGPWSRKTRLVWHWGQFRFETRFTTPEIILYHWRDLQPSSKSKSGNSASTSSNDVLRRVIDLGDPDLPCELRETVRPSVPDDDESMSGDMVSWTSLLRQLYLLQSRWYQSFHSNQLPPSDPANVVGYATKVGVIYRERTWDLMPPDSIRPMASSRLRFVIVLAIRLGMTWENLDVGDGVLRAEGNGHTLISTTMRGFGIVFQYNFNSRQESMRLPQRMQMLADSSGQGLIPRRSTDMMCCGIIPGAPAVQIPAMPLQGKNSVESASLLSAALLWLNVSRATIAKITDVNHLESMRQEGSRSAVGWPINDLIALSSSFQPMKGSTRTQSVYPLETTMALSLFSLPECRRVLLSRLREHVRQQATDQEHLRDVLLRFESLVSRYESDFYCVWDQAIVNDPSASVDTKIQFIDSLREIYDWTTDYFQQIESQLTYTRLLAAHIRLATQAGFEYHQQATTLEDYWENTANAYSEHFDVLEIDLQGSVTKHLISDAWWTLVLRGTVWRMSVYFSHQEKVVPSRLYYDQTPVYIM